MHYVFFFPCSYKQFSPQERLGDFILNSEVSPATVETLHNFLCIYELAYRKRIINAQLLRLCNRTSVHLAAEKGRTSFLRVLLKHGGKYSVVVAIDIFTWLLV